MTPSQPQKAWWDTFTTACHTANVARSPSLAAKKGGVLSQAWSADRCAVGSAAGAARHMAAL